MSDIKQKIDNKLDSLIPKSIDILHEIKSNRIFCSRESLLKFIVNQIDLAIAEERKRVVEMIESQKKINKNLKHFSGNGYYNHQGYNEAIKDIINLMTNTNK